MVTIEGALTIGLLAGMLAFILFERIRAWGIRQTGGESYRRGWEDGVKAVKKQIDARIEIVLPPPRKT